MELVRPPTIDRPRFDVGPRCPGAIPGRGEDFDLPVAVHVGGRAGLPLNPWKASNAYLGEPKFTASKTATVEEPPFVETKSYPLPEPSVSPAAIERPLM